ncbi:MAG: suppressor of fused domain protein [Geitlerinemataceae cyanobacterium]
MTTSQDKKLIAKNYIQVIGGKNPEYSRFFNEDESYSVDLLFLINSPCLRVTTVASIGVSNIPLLLSSGEEYPVRAEIVSCFNEEYDLFPNAVATTAFFVMKDRWLCAPGIVFPNIVSTYYPDIPMKHIYFTSPFFWNGELDTLKTETKTVAFLLAIPISEEERRFRIRHGSDRVNASNLVSHYTEKYLHP